MPMNNNQKFQSAAARLAKLPLVRSACSTVSVLYIDTKSSHPNLRSVCEVLESRVTAISTAACDKMTPVMVRLEPQISIVNDVACKSLDWLETTFPVLHAPTDQVVAAARNKMNEIQDVVSITANGTVDTVTWLMGRIQQVDEQTNQPLVQRAIGVADVGLDSALIMSETLMEHMLPLSEEDKAEAHLLEGFEVATLRRSYRARLLLLAARLCSRTYHLVGSKIQSVQLMESLSRSSGRIQDLQTSWLTISLSIQELPQYLQHQLVSVLFFISQMYNLSSSQSQQQHQDRAHLNAAGTSTHRDVVWVQSRATPTPRARRPTKMSPFENGSNGKGWVHR
ncbi:perilipin-2-like isoform X2 [Notolabrus celidotus]|uniref:perilipin-2-like isoform X2 n=1 Tax=Notolabrus celidotus TaxID=1203425 RepID=UPI00148F4C34|nr:perilipin-2-like isoform X2 [Notolabrus celidotus]